GMISGERLTWILVGKGLVPFRTCWGLAAPRRGTSPRPTPPACLDSTQRRDLALEELRLGKIRVAIIGVGNCASSLVQGVHYYRNAKADEFVPGLMHVNLGGYHISDIEFSAAFDINNDKVGQDLADAIFVKPNNTYKFTDVPETGIIVMRGMTHDGLG